MSTTFPQGTLELNEMKQQLSIAYIRATVATAGMQIQQLDVDYDGIDLTMRSFVDYGAGVGKGSQVDVQLKCTADPKHVGQDAITYSLRREIYEDFSDPERYQPGILAILVVPGNYADWLHQDQDRLLARGCMYFSRGADWPKIGVAAQSKTVKCMRSDILDSERIRSLMHEAAQRRSGVFT